MADPGLGGSENDGLVGDGAAEGGFDLLPELEEGSVEVGEGAEDACFSCDCACVQTGEGFLGGGLIAKAR